MFKVKASKFDIFFQRENGRYVPPENMNIQKNMTIKSCLASGLPLWSYVNITDLYNGKLAPNMV